jgi:hypothetical protein
MLKLRRLVAVFLPRPGSVHVGFVVDKVALEQAFLQYFSFPCQAALYFPGRFLVFISVGGEVWLKGLDQFKEFSSLIGI